MKTERHLLAAFTGIFIFLSVISNLAYADMQYVSDTLILTLRDQPGEDGKVIGTLKTDDPVEVLEKKRGYYHIQTFSGKKGWVVKKYITPSKPKPQVIKELRENIDKLESALAEKERQLANLSSELKRVTDILNRASQQPTGNVALATAGKELLKTSKSYASAAGDPGDTTHRSRKQADQKSHDVAFWFFAGAGVFLIGFIIGKTFKRKKIFY